MRSIPSSGRSSTRGETAHRRGRHSSYGIAVGIVHRGPVKPSPGIDSHSHERPLLRPPHPQLALRVPVAALGARRERPAHEPRPRPSPTRLVHHAGPEAEEPRPARDGLRRGGAGAGEGGTAVRADGGHQRAAAPSRRVALGSGLWPVARDTGDGPAPQALAQPPSKFAKRAAPLRRHPALLLPGRSGGDRDLADRGRARARQRRPPLPRPPRRRQRAGKPRPRTPRAQARDRRRQDHRHGHAHRVADRQRGAPSRQSAVRARFPGGHPGTHHPRSPAGAPAERPGQLLSKPRAGAGRHARRPRPRQDRHHQLPRVHAPRDPRHLEGWPRPPPGPGYGHRDPRDRRADAPAGDAGSHGHEEHPGAQRRGPPLLPREAVRGRRRRPLEGRRSHRGAEEQGSRPGVDLGLGDSAKQARHRARDRPVRDSFLPARVGLRRRNALPLDGERLLAHGCHRERHREAAPRAGRGQHPEQRDADIPESVAPHREENAEEGSGKGGITRPAEHPGRAPDRTRSALRPLRPNLRAVAERRHRSPAVLHHRVQQHLDLEAGLRLRLGLPAGERGRLDGAGGRSARALPELRRIRQSPRPATHAAHQTASSSNPGRRSTRTSGPRPATRSSGSAARSSSGPETADRPRTSRIRTCCARS